MTDSEAIQALASDYVAASNPDGTPVQNRAFQVTDTQNRVANQVQPALAALQQEVADLKAAVAKLTPSSAKVLAPGTYEVK